MRGMRFADVVPDFFARSEQVRFRNPLRFNPVRLFIRVYCMDHVFGELAPSFNQVIATQRVAGVFLRTAVFAFQLHDSARNGIRRRDALRENSGQGKIEVFARTFSVSAIQVQLAKVRDVRPARAFDVIAQRMIEHPRRQVIELFTAHARFPAVAS
jgi:hypothetical protein